MTNRHALLARLLCGALLALLCLTATAGAAGAPPTHRPSGWVTVPRPARAAAAAATPDNLVYHGGPVVHGGVVHAIFWDPTGTAIDPGYEAAINQFFVDLAASGATPGSVFATLPEYYDRTGPAGGAPQYAGTIVARDRFPRSGCAYGLLRRCLTDAQIRAEINHVVAAGHLPRGMGNLYFLFTPKGVGSCDGNGCAYADYCGYHDAFGHGAKLTLYANHPYPRRRDCGVPQQPNGTVADATLSVVSHEYSEMVTDPLFNGWYDHAKEENGDKCAWNFGTTPLGATAYGSFNQRIGAGSYYLQQEWSNAAGGCVLTT